MGQGRYFFAFLLYIALGGPALCQIQVLTDNFTGTSATQAWQVYGTACLTAGSGAGSIPACASGSQGGLTGAVPDSAGSGMLRLTQAVTNDQGGIVSLNAFPSSAGFTATFTGVSYGGSGADGISLFLLDASKGVPATLGAAGGGLSYAGISGGYVGIGIDEWGNFPNPGCGGGGCSGGPGFIANYVAVRGASAGSNAYIGGASPGFSLWSNTSPRNAATQHTYAITLTSAGMVSVAIDGTTRLSNVNAFSQTGTIPAYLRVGIAASTGAATNVHEIKALSISSLSLSTIVTVKTSTVISDPINGTTNPKVIPGARVRYCIQVSNLAGSPAATSVVVSDPIASIPITYVAGSIYLNGTVTNGSCNWNGTSGGTYASGKVTGSLATIAAGATATLYFDATVN